MHRLDGHIRDIELRLKEIINSIPQQEGVSLQASLAAYGWIMLDSWVAWRTLRFLLRKLVIDDKVHDKWFQTPSSYSSGQLMAVWQFQVSTLDYIKSETSHSFKELIDTILQGKRNASAHVKTNNTVEGRDYRNIDNMFECLSKVFTHYETCDFIVDATEKFRARGFGDFLVQYSNGVVTKINDIYDCIVEYAGSKSLTMKMYKEHIEYCVTLSDNGSFIWKENEPLNDKCPINNASHDEYMFFKDKGYYVSVGLFVETVCQLIEKKYTC